MITVLTCMAMSPALAWSVQDFADPLATCPKDLPSADIRIALSMFDPPVYQNYTIAQLGQFPSRSASPFPSDAIVHTYGLTRNPLQILGKLRIESLQNPFTRKKCFWFKSIDLTLEVKPMIFMGSEIKPGSCYYNAVLQHELEHANIERKLLQDYQPIIVKTMTQFVLNTGFVRDVPPEDDNETIYARLQQRLDEQLDIIHQHMEPVRAARQAEIDTRESYERTALPCRAVEKPPY